MRLQILWSDNFTEFDQIPHLQNLIRFLIFRISIKGRNDEHFTGSHTTISPPSMRLQILWSDNFAEFDQIPHLQNLE